MGLPVKLSLVVEELEMRNDLIDAYINRETGETVIVTEDDKSALRQLEDGGDIEDLPGWQRDYLPKLQGIEESEVYIPLPSKFEIHEYDIMRRFIGTLEDDALRGTMEELIRGSGAFRRFRDAIERYRIGDKWWQYRSEALKQIAIRFLDSEGIPWVDE
jgi:hypothetical protein